MNSDDAINKIERYLKKDYVGPMIVDLQNKADLDSIETHFMLPKNKFISASDPTFCNQDEFPAVDRLLELFTNESSDFFVSEISTFFMLRGEDELSQILKEFLNLNIAGHVVIFTFKCEQYLNELIKTDKRLASRICVVPGIQSINPRLVFLSGQADIGKDKTIVKGLDKLAHAIDESGSDTIYIETKQTKQNFPSSLYEIIELNCSYDMLNMLDRITAMLPQELGTAEDWDYAYELFKKYPSWEKLISVRIGEIDQLDKAIFNYRLNSSDKHWLWLYFIGLRLFGAGDNRYLDKAASDTTDTSEFIQNIYRTILTISPRDSSFGEIYSSRKMLLNALGNPTDETISFCKLVPSKERDALCYLTDNTTIEKELIIKLLDKYGLKYDKSELLDILKTVYPDLYYYMEIYHFKDETLDTYFQDYKYQKLINKVFPEFLDRVEHQAAERYYNSILLPRSTFTEKIDTADTQTYFTDAMGVEYLGYIMSRCHELGIMAKVTVCRSELPSITVRNKEFWDILSTPRYPIITVDKLDKIKHHGDEGYDYSREDKKLPFHLIRELEIIDELLHKIKADLTSGIYSKAVLISDHGSSRLAVIHETENLWQMESSGIHSGRCCPKSDLDSKPDNAADADDFWALANYDRFKGSRRANVEVHGGATLEEVVIPIIELTTISDDIEICLMPADASANFTGIPELTVSYRKKAAVKIYSTEPLENVSITIDGHTYDADSLGDNFYIIRSMPEITRAKTYSVDVFACGNKVAEALLLKVKKESGSEKSIL